MTKIIPYILAAVLAVGGYFLGATPGESLAIALDKDKAKAACVKLLEGESVALPVTELPASETVPAPAQ